MTQTDIGFLFYLARVITGLSCMALLWLVCERHKPMAYDEYEPSIAQCVGCGNLWTVADCPVPKLYSHDVGSLDLLDCPSCGKRLGCSTI